MVGVIGRATAKDAAALAPPAGVKINNVYAAHPCGAAGALAGEAAALPGLRQKGEVAAAPAAAPAVLLALLAAAAAAAF